MKVIATNKKAYQNFLLTDKWEAGISLTGGEVKSLRDGQADFKGSHVRIEEGQAYLHNLHINPYKQASYLNEEPERPRKLLLHKREILKIDTKMRERNLTLVPTKIYFTARGLVKVEIVFGQGKKRYDKRADIKKRETDRGLKRVLKTRRG